MKTIRMGTFETNSSSTHSIAICTKEQYEKWVHGELYLNDCGSYHDKDNIIKGKEFITKDEAINFLKHYNYINDEEDDLDYVLQAYDIYSYNSWGEDYEHDSHSFTTPSGDEMVAECFYGYDC